MQPYLQKQLSITPDWHQYAAEKERNGNTTFEKSSKLSVSEQSDFFGTAGHRKQTMNSYCRKTRTLPKKPEPSMQESPKSLMSILKRMTGVTESINRQAERNVEDNQKKKQEMQNYAVDTRLRGKKKKSLRKIEYHKKFSDDPYAQTEESNKRNNLSKPAASSLSGVQRSNFRIRLYYQLNVVKRQTVKSPYINSLKMKGQEHGSYCPAARIKLRHSYGVERSTPIAMQSRRISDVDFVNEDTNLRKEKTSHSDIESENEDVFVLDIEPIPNLDI